MEPDATTWWDIFANLYGFVLYFLALPVGAVALLFLVLKGSAVLIGRFGLGRRYVIGAASALAASLFVVAVGVVYLIAARYYLGS